MRGHTMLIGNCGMVQGGIRLLPDAVLDDGKLDVLMISADGALQWLDTLRSFVWDNGIRRISVRPMRRSAPIPRRHLPVENISVQLKTPLMFEIDGEEMGELSAFEVRVEAGRPARTLKGVRPADCAGQTAVTGGTIFRS